MASEMIGRAVCPECGFESAHIKKSEKCTYRYCPQCSSQTHARTPEQVKHMTAKMRPVAAVTPGSPTSTPTVPEKTAPAQPPAAAPTPTEPSSTSAVDLQPVQPAKRRGLFA